MRAWRSTGSFLLVALSALGCSPGRQCEPGLGRRAAQESMRKVGDKIFLVGELTPAVASEFARQVTAEVTPLVITSGGGHTRSAVEIGRVVHAHGLRVIVSRACMSGCAHFIFAAARERIIQPDSLVIFHNTRSSIARMGAALRSSETEPFQRAADEDAKLEQTFNALE